MGIARRSRALALALALVAALPLSISADEQRSQAAHISAVPAEAVASVSLEGLAKPAAPDEPVALIVKLADAPLAAYDGDLPGLAATSPQATGTGRLDATSQASQRYLAYLDRQQQAFVSSALAAVPQARVTARYRFVFGGAALVVPESQVDRIASLPGVVSVERDYLRQPHTSNSPGFIGADVLWRALEADPNLGDGGEGVIVGVIDTGIWPEHPSFADDGSYPAPPAHWRGACEAPRDSSPAITCTNKLIGARVHLDTYRELRGLGKGEFDSARDNEGHGTHTASTAAGNADVAAVVFGRPRGTVSGIAPRAHVAAYKGLGAAGGYGADLVAAIDRAVADGVDVINYSIGSLAAGNPYTDADSLAFLDAYRAGVFVSVSAGNAGPNAGTVGSPANAPWVMSVGASTTDRTYVSELTLRAGAAELRVSGVSITAGVSETRVINAAALGDQRCERRLPATVSETIVLCMRGGNGRVEKSANVRAGGGAGMVLYNAQPQDVMTDNHWIPTVHLDAPQGSQVISFTTTYSNVTVLGSFGASQPVDDPSFADIVASFSSRGPLDARRLGISKPDIVAPGVQILAGHTPAPNDPAGGPSGELFQAIAGTSMAAPHIAGAGALLKALHPEWTPGQIKSALMTTAWTRLVKQDGVTPADPYDVGAGRVDLARAGDPGLTLDVSAEAYASGATHLQDLNYPGISIPALYGRASVTRLLRSEVPTDTVWTVSADLPPGITLSANPAQIPVSAYGHTSVIFTVDAGGVAPGTYFGSVTLRSDGRAVRMPVTLVRAEPAVALEKRCAPDVLQLGQRTDCTITVTNTSTEAASVTIRDTMPPALPIATETISGARVLSGTNSLLHAGRLPGRRGASIDVISGTTSIVTGYVSLASLGVPPSNCSTNCDDDAITYIAPEFNYGGQTYDRVSVTTNGYLMIGDTRTLSIFNQRFPNPNPPNNVIAPYWTDLDLDGTGATDPGGGRWYAAYVTFGSDPTRWFVAEWTDAAKYRGDPAVSRHTFQVWIQGGSGRVLMVYGPNSPTEDALTVGAENNTGTSGDTLYYDGTRDNKVNGVGVVPVEGDVLEVVATAEQINAYTISFEAVGAQPGVYTTTAELTSNLFAGTSVATATVTIERPPAPPAPAVRRLYLPSVSR